jgi:mannose-6-phosphate isomerase-like protein (cupin superfamily)
MFLWRLSHIVSPFMITSWHIGGPSLQVTLEPGDAIEFPLGLSHKVEAVGSPISFVVGARGRPYADMEITWLTEPNLEGVTAEPIPA